MELKKSAFTTLRDFGENLENGTRVGAGVKAR